MNSNSMRLPFISLLQTLQDTDVDTEAHLDYHLLLNPETYDLNPEPLEVQMETDPVQDQKPPLPIAASNDRLDSVLDAPPSNEEREQSVMEELRQLLSSPTLQQVQKQPAPQVGFEYQAMPNQDYPPLSGQFHQFGPRQTQACPTQSTQTDALRKRKRAADDDFSVPVSERPKSESEGPAPVSKRPKVDSGAVFRPPAPASAAYLDLTPARGSVGPAPGSARPNPAPGSTRPAPVPARPAPGFTRPTPTPESMHPAPAPGTTRPAPGSKGRIPLSEAFSGFSLYKHQQWERVKNELHTRNKMVLNAVLQKRWERLPEDKKARYTAKAEELKRDFIQTKFL